MQITDIRVRKVLDDGKMKGVVSVTFDNEFVIHDIKVIEGKNGYFVAMPSKRLSEGGFKDIAHPINMQSRERLQDAILRAYDEAKSLAEVSADFGLE
ncbi:MAG: septation regulator SpoVG [Peptoclostridium sp.]|uniref:septation regulator SpoVG n=1 Tax=Peptoclostridium sp. TaxID=1904860 RepID=UPI00139F0561|nr:septation regulator SpoVG [Peptoclostridium sp.]MZQ74975.1 septation regulator SpoVG [Peptoclostridium sp.]